LVKTVKTKGRSGAEDDSVRRARNPGPVLAAEVYPMAGMGTTEPVGEDWHPRTVAEEAD
jgi:hypothetical protein